MNAASTPSPKDTAAVPAERAYPYRPVVYFLLAFGLSWIPWMAAARLSTHQPTRDFVLLLNLIGMLGPAIAAFVLILTAGNRTLMLDFRRRLFDVGALRSWNALAIVVIPVSVVMLSLSLALSVVWGDSADQFRFAIELSGRPWTT